MQHLAERGQLKPFFKFLPIEPSGYNNKDFGSQASLSGIQTLELGYAVISSYSGEQNHLQDFLSNSIGECAILKNSECAILKN